MTLKCIVVGADGAEPGWRAHYRSPSTWRSSTRDGARMLRVALTATEERAGFSSPLAASRWARFRATGPYRSERTGRRRMWRVTSANDGRDRSGA